MAKREGFTFNSSEVRAMAQLFTTLRRGGDVATLLRSQALHSVEKKITERNTAMKEEN